MDESSSPVQMAVPTGVSRFVIALHIAGHDVIHRRPPVIGSRHYHYILHDALSHIGHVVVERTHVLNIMPCRVSNQCQSLSVSLSLAVYY
jgi:hypothetical protein